MHPDIDADHAAIRTLREALRTAVNAGDVPGILACWAPDGVLMPPHHPRVEGHEAMAGYFRELFERRRLAFTFSESRVTLAGDVAVERLTYAAMSTPRPGGPATDDVGKGLHVYARGPGTQWRLVQDIWNSDRP